MQTLSTAPAAIMMSTRNTGPRRSIGRPRIRLPHTAEKAWQRYGRPLRQVAVGIVRKISLWPNHTQHRCPLLQRNRDKSSRVFACVRFFRRGNLRSQSHGLMTTPSERRNAPRRRLSPVAIRNTRSRKSQRPLDHLLDHLGGITVF